jgi:hypothetical protein
LEKKKRETLRYKALCESLQRVSKCARQHDSCRGLSYLLLQQAKLPVKSSLSQATYDKQVETRCFNIGQSKAATSASTSAGFSAQELTLIGIGGLVFLAVVYSYMSQEAPEEVTKDD